MLVIRILETRHEMNEGEDELLGEIGTELCRMDLVHARTKMDELCVRVCVRT